MAPGVSATDPRRTRPPWQCEIRVMDAQQHITDVNEQGQPVLRNGRTGGRPWRIALYSPGMVGIGHMRRNLRIAQALAGSPLEAVILMIAEAREANVLALP